MPHLPIQWFTDNQSSELFLEGLDSTNPTYDRYIPQTDRVATRHRRKYKWVSTDYGQHPVTGFASVTMVSPTVAELHSSILLPQQPRHSPPTTTQTAYLFPGSYVLLW
jgi:hypothetical protein